MKALILTLATLALSQTAHARDCLAPITEATTPMCSPQQQDQSVLQRIARNLKIEVAPYAGSDNDTCALIRYNLDLAVTVLIRETNPSRAQITHAIVNRESRDSSKFSCRMGDGRGARDLDEEETETSGSAQ